MMDTLTGQSGLNFRPIALHTRGAFRTVYIALRRAQKTSLQADKTSWKVLEFCIKPKSDYSLQTVMHLQLHEFVK